ncbi:MAG TPA: RNA pseudouridine synthase, partial [Bacteroidetes bacterium]|nr:RNA pseudouridine synthase [Bacteroidota bacterium]
MPINSEENIEVQEDGLFLKYSFTVDKGQEPLRIDKFLVDRIERASRNKLQEAIERKQVIVDGKAVKSNYKVKPSDFIEVLVDKEPEDLE